MSTGRLLLLGAVAGSTIFLGLPMGRLRSPRPRLRAFLNAVAAGVLLFLLWDVLSHAVEPVEDALTAAAVRHQGSWLAFARLGGILIVGLAAGVLSLVYYDRWAFRRAAARSAGPGAAAVTEFETAALHHVSQPRVLALSIAVGIGLHNFSEGLAIGQSAAKGEVSLALLLIVGFGLHNATEGFGIVAPLAVESHRPTWRFLTLLGLIGGGPTFLGTVVGRSMVSETLFLAFLALAAGSILYVVIELLNMGRKLGYKELLVWGLLLGFSLGLATDFVLVAAGA